MLFVLKLTFLLFFVDLFVLLLEMLDFFDLLDRKSNNKRA